MNDRPMRLKYLTKMKIILCIFLLCITVSVFGQSVELNGTLGESVKFPAAVKKGGGLMHSGTTIGNVTSGSFTAGKFSSRLRWDSSTGLFSISGLKMEDSGEYKVQNTDQNINTVFQLNVYIPVSKPNVRITHNEYPCTIECTAERGTGVTLSWYREGEEKPYVSSGVASTPYLHLTAPAERSGTYTCEAKNSVSNEKASITVGADCRAPPCPSPGTIAAIIIAVVASIIAAVVTAGFFALKYRHFGRMMLAAKSELEAANSKLEAAKSEHEAAKSELEAANSKLKAAKSEHEVRRLLHSLVPPECAVRRFILVKHLLDNLVLPAYDDENVLSIEDVRRIVLVKKLLQSLCLLIQYDDENVLSIEADNKVHEVQKHLDSLVPPAYVKQLFENVDPRAYDKDEQALIQDAVRRIFLAKAKVAFPPDDKDEQALIQDAVGRILLELRGPAKGNDEPEDETPRTGSYHQPSQQER